MANVTLAPTPAAYGVFAAASLDQRSKVQPVSVWLETAPASGQPIARPRPK
jgi:hypothetical protein